MSRVLLIEDHPSMRLVLKQTLLSIAPAEVVEVSSFKSATELLQLEVFDGVCVDLNLDGEEGSNWVEQLLQTNPLLNVMIYSACNDLAVYQALLAAGVKVIVVKSNQMPILQIGLPWYQAPTYFAPTRPSRHRWGGPRPWPTPPMTICDSDRGHPGL